MPNEQSPRAEVQDGPVRIFNTLAVAQLASPKYLGQIFVTLDGYLAIPRGYGTGHVTDNIKLASGLVVGGDLTIIGGLVISGQGSGIIDLTPAQVFLGRVYGLTQEIVAAGAVDIISLTSTIASVAAIALTLADGGDSQFKSIAMITDGGDATLTPAHFANGSTIVFNDVGDSVLLQFLGGKWQVMSNFGCTIA